MKRNFNDYISNLKTTISDYKYYTDFEKVQMKVDQYKEELISLNQLIGSTQIKIDFERLVKDNPNVIKVIPILLAKRDVYINVLDNGEKEFRFDYLNLSIEEYSDFMENTGIFRIMETKTITSLIDYVVGIEVGLDSNARKNRTGTQFANIVESYIKQSKFNNNYFKEADKNFIKKKFGIDLNIEFKDKRTNKRFDFLIKSSNCLYLIEVNYYYGGGSKLNETARSYILLNSEISKIKNVKFMWITDGLGWNSVKGGLKDAYNQIEHIYTLADIEQGLFDKL